MAAPIDDRNRRMVPRWRTFRVSCSMGLLDGADTSYLRKPLQAAPGEIEELQDSWGRRRSLTNAAELVDAAIVLGNPELATDAAEFLLEEGGISEASLMLAKHVISAESDQLHLEDVPRVHPVVKVWQNRTVSPDTPTLARQSNSLGRFST